MDTDEREKKEGELQKIEYGLIFKAILEGNKSPTMIYEYFKTNYSLIEQARPDKKAPSYDEITRKLTILTSNFHFLLKTKPGKITDYEIDYLNLVKRLIKLLEETIKFKTVEGIIPFMNTQHIAWDSDFKEVQIELEDFMQYIYVRQNKVLAIKPMFKLFIKDISEEFFKRIIGEKDYFLSQYMLTQLDKTKVKSDLTELAEDLNKEVKEKNNLSEIASEMYNEKISDEQLKNSASMFMFWFFCKYATEKKLLD